MSLITTPTNLDYLITPLRLHIFDTTEPYTFSDDELRTQLVYAVKALMPRWNNRYLINADTNYVERNPNGSYQFPDPPVIQSPDERPIILQAAIDVKGSFLYSSSQGAVSWKDDEVSYSNTNSIKAMEAGLLRDIAELESILPIARKRLAQASKQSLPGFENDYNSYEG